MNIDLFKKGALTEDTAVFGPMIQQMVAERASELAVINGRSADDVSELDLEQAKRELCGEPDTDPKDAIPEGSPEAERWDSDPGLV